MGEKLLRLLKRSSQFEEPANAEVEATLFPAQRENKSALRKLDQMVELHLNG